MSARPTIPFAWIRKQFDLRLVVWNTQVGLQAGIPRWNGSALWIGPFVERVRGKPLKTLPEYNCSETIDLLLGDTSLLQQPQPGFDGITKGDTDSSDGDSDDGDGTRRIRTVNFADMTSVFDPDLGTVFQRLNDDTSSEDANTDSGGNSDSDDPSDNGDDPVESIPKADTPAPAPAADDPSQESKATSPEDNLLLDDASLEKGIGAPALDDASLGWPEYNPEDYATANDQVEAVRKWMGTEMGRRSRIGPLLLESYWALSSHQDRRAFLFRSLRRMEPQPTSGRGLLCGVHALTQAIEDAGVPLPFDLVHETIQDAQRSIGADEDIGRWNFYRADVLTRAAASLGFDLAVISDTDQVHWSNPTLVPLAIANTGAHYVNLRLHHRAQG